MKEETSSMTYFVYDHMTDCSDEIQKLFEEANKAQKRAYAPYSNFKVGAAILLENGKIFTGNNQENAAYPSGLCAERVAIFAAKSHYPNVHIKSLALVSSAKDNAEPVAPCGSCRQVLAEYEFLQKKPYHVYLQAAKNSVIQIASAQSLLPFGFHADLLD